MRSVRGPPHLLLLDKALADHLVDGRFDEPAGDGLAVPAAIPIIGDGVEIGRHIVHELLEFVLHSCCALGLGADSPGQFFDCVQRPMRAAVPEVGP